MRRRTLALLVAFVLGLVIGAAAAVSAQSAPVNNTDLSLRVVGHRNGRVVGRLMAKVDGKWVEVQLASENVLATP